MRRKDESLGYILIIALPVGFVAYTWLMFFTPLDIMLLKFSAVIALGALIGYLLWMAKVMIRVPPPPSLNEEDKN